MGRLMVLSVLTLGVILAGCKSDQDYQTLRRDKAQKDFETISKRTLPADKVLTLPMCVNEALKNNLDLKVEDLQTQVNKESKTAAMLGMLPQLTMTYNLQTRSNQPGSSSQDLKTGETSLQTSRSSRMTENDESMELGLSVIDFGMAYFNSIQAQDNIILGDTQRLRVAQNLIYDITRTYVEVAATQDAIAVTKDLVKQCQDMEKVFEALRDNRSMSNLRVLDEQKRFVGLEKQLMLYQRNYEDACIRLRTLMGYLPLEDITVDASLLKNFRYKNFPPVEKLEEAALYLRPELSKLDIQRHINVIETRKSILEMFPNVKLFTDWQHSSNPFLYKQSWWDIGMKTSYDLLHLPSKAMHTQSLMEQNAELEARTRALSIAVMSEVRLAYVNMMEMKRIYDHRALAYKVYQQQFELARKTYAAGSALSRFELDRMALETVDRRIRCVQAMGDLYVAYYRVLNTVGVSSLEQNEIDHNINHAKQLGLQAAAKAAGVQAAVR